jgi:hypothetical protein
MREERVDAKGLVAPSWELMDDHRLGGVELTWPIELRSIANQSMHWAEKSKYMKSARKSGRMMMTWGNAATVGRLELLRHDGLAGHSGLTIFMTRLSQRTLDNDNLYTAFKPFRDGIADWLEVDDGDTLLEWNCFQRYSKQKGVVVRVFLSKDRGAL